jgi:hypothetical protein
MNLLNGTNKLDTSIYNVGKQRWDLHTFSFITGLKNTADATVAANNIKLGFNPWGPDMSIHISQLLPHINEKLFYAEAKTWLPLLSKKKSYKPSLPGHCPGPIKVGEDVAKYDILLFFFIS